MPQQHNCRCARFRFALACCYRLGCTAATHAPAVHLAMFHASRFPSLLIHAALEHLDLLCNRLTALPPALSTATALTCLVLSINTRLKLSDSDVEGILLRMPRLAELHLDNTDTHPAVLERLQQARPHLSIR